MFYKFFLYKNLVLPEKRFFQKNQIPLSRFNVCQNAKLVHIIKKNINNYLEKHAITIYISDIENSKNNEKLSRSNLKTVN